MEKDITIGITGGIGAGKSVVSRILRCNGFFVYDCDSRAKFLMETDLDIIRDLKEGVGEDIYSPDNRIEKKLLADRMFSDLNVRRYVNSVVHAAVRKDIGRCRREIPGYLFIESAILASSGLDHICNSIWIVEASARKRMERVAKRSNLSASQIEKRMESQARELELLKGGSTIELLNDGNNPILGEILKLTDKFINHQTYILPC